MTCLYCTKPAVDLRRCQDHLAIYRRMMAIPADPTEARRERRWEARVSR